MKATNVFHTSLAWGVKNDIVVFERVKWKTRQAFKNIWAGDVHSVHKDSGDFPCEFLIGLAFVFH